PPRRRVDTVGASSYCLRGTRARREGPGGDPNAPERMPRSLSGTSVVSIRTRAYEDLGCCRPRDHIGEVPEHGVIRMAFLEPKPFDEGRFSQSLLEMGKHQAQQILELLRLERLRTRAVSLVAFMPQYFLDLCENILSRGRG